MTKTTFPPLFHKAKTGATHDWTVWAEGDQVFTSHGTLGGLHQNSAKRCTGKNIGRSNETTPEAQAIAEAQSMHTHKLERKYSLTLADAQEELFLPMLAHPIEKAKKVVFPAHAQAKLDGVRCLAYWNDGKIELMSRSGKPYTVPHIQEQLAKMLPPDTVLDGELYKLGLSCQTVTSLVKRIQPRTLEIDYNIYDMPTYAGDDSLPWERRQQALYLLMNPVMPDASKALHEDCFSLVLVKTEDCESMEALKAFERECVEKGYEGAMYRSFDGLYEWGYRSKSLLKVKSFEDHEYTVVDARQGEGKMEGCVVWRCTTKDGKEFDVSMACTMAERARYYKERQKYIWKDLTVKHFGLTDDGVPRFPVGKLFRDAKDLG